MKYTINGFSQEKLIEYGIDLSSSLILRVIADMYTSNSKKLEFKLLDDDKYMWCTYGYLLDQIPILGTERTLIRKIDSLIEKNILKKKILGQRKGKLGRYLYISLGENYESLTEYNSNDKLSSEQMTNCQDPNDKMTFEQMTNCHDKDSSITDTSIIDSSISSSADETTQQLDEKSIEFRKNITELKNIIINSTGENPVTVDMVFKPVIYSKIIIQLLEKIKASKFLMGQKETKPKLHTFIRQDRINEILAGFYDDYKKEKNIIVTTEQDLKNQAKREKEQKEFEKILGL